ncbi:MAG: hypothetical protein U0U67_14845 [Chitinophagales bacterium]
MKKILLVVFITIVYTTTLLAQNVGVNSTGATPDVSAMLDVVAANKGLLIPRVALSSATDNATIATPATSLLVYNTNTSMTNGQGIGYYYNSGTTTAPLWVKLSQANEAWLLRGNTGITTPAIPATYGSSTIGTTENFLGTKDANDVVLGTNNIERFRMKQNTGYIGLGTASPIVKMDIVAPDTIGLRILSGSTTRLTYLSLGRTTEYAQIGAATAGTFFTDAANGDMIVKNFNSGKLLLGASYSSTADMAITPTYGNIGIKTVTPNSRLDVNGDLALREGPAMALTNTTYPTITLPAGSKFSHYRITGPTVPFWPYIIYGGNDGQVVTFINTTGQPMNVYNYNAANGIITGSGNHLVSTSTSNSSFTAIYNASLQRWIVTGYTGMTAINDNDWHTFGNTAITTPAVPATYGTTNIGTAENWVGTTDANDYVIGTNRIERMRVMQTSGNVGIGIATPAAKLHVYTTGVGARIEMPSGSSDGLDVWHYGTGRGIYAYTAGSANALYAYSTTGTGVNAQSGNSGYGLYAYSPSSNGVYASSGNSGYGVYAYSPYATGVYGNSYGSNGIYGYSSTATGVYGNASSASQTGVIGYSGGNYLDLGWASCSNCGSPTTSSWYITPGGSGVGAAGEYIGVQGKAYYANTSTYDKMGGMFYVAGYNGGSSWGLPAFAAVGSVVDNTVYKIVGLGIVSTLVKDTEDKERVMVAPEAPEALFQDYGVGKLENGKATIKLDPTLTKNIQVDDKHPMKVFIQLEGDCKGVYVTNKSATGFEVIELQNGTSDVSFSYQIVANRADENRDGVVSKYSDMRFKPLNRQLILDKEKVKVFKDSEKTRIENDKKNEEQLKLLQQNKTEEPKAKTEN